MGIFRSESDEERERRRAAELERIAFEQDRRQMESAAREQATQEARFLESPPGLARTSHRRGDYFFQVSIDLEDIAGYVVALDNAYTTRSTNDATAVLNAIRDEGWDLHAMSTTFVNEGEVSRDRFLASGQQVAVRGRIVGTYLFTRRSW